MCLFLPIQGEQDGSELEDTGESRVMYSARALKNGSLRLNNIPGDMLSSKVVDSQQTVSGVCSAVVCFSSQSV